MARREEKRRLEWDEMKVNNMVINETRETKKDPSSKDLF
jgi:hypothetical protein